ncbi:HIT family protein [Halobaculum sp. MBLA0147]|uniref:HIT family protein n=1 Tax=Halobaculum sp. MBLA0147 TaxID=3079934 RepID=UPI003523465D
MSDCPFCGIVAGEIPGRIVGENDHAVAFLDANPMAPGHTLVVPREHRERLADATSEETQAVFALLHELAPKIETAVDAEGATVGLNDGSVAGQEVPHVHAHVIPRFPDDDGGPIHVAAGSRPELSDAELDEIAAAIGDD